MTNLVALIWTNSIPKIVLQTTYKQQEGVSVPCLACFTVLFGRDYSGMS